MKVIICGSRDWTDRQAIADRVAKLPTDAIVIQGDAKGADTIAAEFAWRLGRQVVSAHANWERHGKAAGPIRNSAMLALGPDLVIAFSSTQPQLTKGTNDMVKKAIEAGVEVEGHGPQGLTTTWNYTAPDGTRVGTFFHGSSTAIGIWPPAQGCGTSR